MHSPCNCVNLCDEFNYFHPTIPRIPARSSLTSASSSSSSTSENRFGENQNISQIIQAIPINDKPNYNPERGLNFDSIILDECCFWEPITIIDNDRFFLPTLTLFRDPNSLFRICYGDKTKSVPGMQNDVHRFVSLFIKHVQTVNDGMVLFN